jgi:hypothetical protein
VVGLLRRGSARRKAATYTQNKRTQTSMPWVVLEPTIPASSERRRFMPQTARPLWSATGSSWNQKLGLECRHYARLPMQYRVLTCPIADVEGCMFTCRSAVSANYEYWATWCLHFHHIASPRSIHVSCRDPTARILRNARLGNMSKKSSNIHYS